MSKEWEYVKFVKTAKVAGGPELYIKKIRMQGFGLGVLASTLVVASAGVIAIAYKNSKQKNKLDGNEDIESAGNIKKELILTDMDNQKEFRTVVKKETIKLDSQKEG